MIKQLIRVKINKIQRNLIQKQRTLIEMIIINNKSSIIVVMNKCKRTSQPKLNNIRITFLTVWVVRLVTLCQLKMIAQMSLAPRFPNQNWKPVF